MGLVKPKYVSEVLRLVLTGAVIPHIEWIWRDSTKLQHISFPECSVIHSSLHLKYKDLVYNFW